MQSNSNPSANDKNDIFYFNNPFVPTSFQAPVSAVDFEKSENLGDFGKDACNVLKNLGTMIHDHFTIEEQKYFAELASLINRVKSGFNTELQIMQTDKERQIFNPVLKNILSSLTALAETGKNIQAPTPQVFSEISSFINKFHDSVCSPGCNEKFKTQMLEYAFIFACQKKLEILGIDTKALSNLVPPHELCLSLADTMLAQLRKFKNSSFTTEGLFIDSLRHKLEEIKCRLSLFPILIAEINHSSQFLEKYRPASKKFNICEETEVIRSSLMNVLDSLLETPFLVKVEVRKDKFISNMLNKIPLEYSDNIKQHLTSPADCLVVDFLTLVNGIQTKQTEALDNLKKIVNSHYENPNESPNNKLILMKAAISHAWSTLSFQSNSPDDALTIALGNFIDEMPSYSVEKNINPHQESEEYISPLPKIKMRLIEFNKTGSNLSIQVKDLPSLLKEKLDLAKKSGKHSNEKLNQLEKFFNKIIAAAIQIQQLSDPFPEITATLSKDTFDYADMKYCMRMLKDRIIQPHLNNDFKIRANQCLLLTLAYKKIFNCNMEIDNLANALIVPMQRLTKLGLFANEALKDLQDMQKNDPDSERYAFEIDSAIEDTLDLQCRAKMISKITNSMMSVIDFIETHIPDYDLFNIFDKDEVTPSIIKLMVTFIMEYQFESEHEFALKLDKQFSVYPDYMREKLISPCDYLIYDFMQEFNQNKMEAMDLNQDKIGKLIACKENLNTVHENPCFDNEAKLIWMWAHIEGLYKNVKPSLFFNCPLHASLGEFLRRKADDLSYRQHNEMDSGLKKFSSVKK